MNISELKRKIDGYLSKSPKKPDCFSDDKFLYCWCGKCKSKDYDLPKDFAEIMAIKVVNDAMRKITTSG